MERDSNKRLDLLQLRRRLIALCLALLASGRPVPAASAQAAVEVRVTPGNAQVAVGETGDVAVEVVNVQDVYGFDVSLTFDPAILEVVDSDPSLSGVQIALGTLLDPGLVVRNMVDNAAGQVQFVMTQLNPSEAKSGTGTLIVLRLRGKRAGASSMITIDQVQLARRDGVTIPAEPVAGRVDVLAADSGQPTNTPMPTQNPGTVLPTTPPDPAQAQPTSSPPTQTPIPSTDAAPGAQTVTASARLSQAAGTGTASPETTRPPVTVAPVPTATPTTGPADNPMSTPGPQPTLDATDDLIHSLTVQPLVSASPPAGATPAAVAAAATRPAATVVSQAGPQAPASENTRSATEPGPARPLLWIGLLLAVGTVAIGLARYLNRQHSLSRHRHGNGEEP